jgi:drug/metabolite transporter (DMT)-like permease
MSILILTLYIISGIFYSISASLPFWIAWRNQIILAILVGIGANVTWVMISRNVNKIDIPIYGLYYDIMLTSIFILVPFIFIPFTLTRVQILGIVLVLLGLIFIKK